MIDVRWWWELDGEQPRRGLNLGGAVVEMKAVGGIVLVCPLRRDAVVWIEGEDEDGPFAPGSLTQGRR